MDTRYVIQPSRAVPGAGREPISIGFPVGSEMVNDICICCIGSTDFIPLNSKILRECLLSSTELLKAIGLSVKNIEQKQVEVQEEKPIGKPVKAKKAKED